jgi:two-component system alkaline phosphatase synthesis response regulator PhoP
MDKRILIIDDDPDLAEAISSLLEANGYAVEYADNGRLGFEKAKDRPPALILLDVMMREKTEGFDVSRKLAGDPGTNSVPVVLLTGIRKELNLPYALEPDGNWLPVRAVIEKPVKPAELLRVVGEQIGGQ